MLLLDNSAWTRLLQGSVPEDRADVIGDWMDRDELAVCLPFLLEAGYSAQSAAKYRSMMTKFGELPRIAIDREVERMAQQAQRELAEIGHHRLAPIDILIAACADRADAGVLHYDGDYDILARSTSLSFHSEWLAPPGSL